MKTMLAAFTLARVLSASSDGVRIKPGQSVKQAAGQRINSGSIQVEVAR